MLSTLLFCILISLLALLYFTYQGDKPLWRIGIKTLTSVLFLSVGLVAILQHSSPSNYHGLLFLGLIFGAIGDVFLGFADELPLEKNKLFFGGVVAFAFAHGAFILAFLTKIDSISLIQSLLFTLLTTILFALGTRNRFFQFYGFKPLILSYTAIISLMLVIGLQMSLPIMSQGHFLVLLGVLLFAFSDFVLCFAYFFHRSHRLVNTVNLSSYYLAEIFLALSLLYM